MKLLFFIILVSVQTFLPLAQGQTIRDIINDYIDRLKNLIPEEVDLPELELPIPENDYISGYISLSNGTAIGLREFNVDVEYRGVLIPIPTGFTITINNLEVYQKLLAELQLSELDAPDRSLDITYNTITTDVVIEGELDFTLLPLNFSVTSLAYNIGGIEFKLEGIVNEVFSSLLSTILTRTVAPTLNILQEPISAAAVTIINRAIGSIRNETEDAYPEKAPVKDSYEKDLESLKRFFKTLESNLEN